VQVSGLSGVTAVAGGGSHTVALKADGTVWAWGYNNAGQLGDTTTTDRLAPVQVSGLGGITAVAAGELHTAALKSDGTVWAWVNSYVIGDGTTTDRLTPVQTSGLSLFPMCGPRAICNAGTGTCLALPAANGTACNDSNACTQTDTCQAGTCTGASPVMCAAPDQCHTAGSCDPATGLCSTPAKPDGSLCNDSDACTQTDLCQAGICIGASPVTCAAPDQCHDAGTCNSATGLCSNPPKLDGSSCNDANPCTQTDVCQAGTCTGSNPVVCAALDACHTPGSCDPQSGTCSTPPAPSGTICGPVECSGSTLNASQVCDGNGVCQPGQPKDCAPFTCAAAACKTICALAADCATGATCVAGSCTFDADGDGYLNLNDNCPLNANPLQTDTDHDGTGDVCDSDIDGDGYPNLADNCPLVANDQSDKNKDGIGDACDCANPLKPDGTVCDDGNACTQTDTCQSGTCVGANVLTCPPLGECEVGLCNPANGVCLPVHKQDKTPCAGGICLAGGCYVEGATSSSSGSGVGSSGSSGATGSGGMAGASTSAAGATSATTGSGMSPGTGGAAGAITLQGGACGIGGSSTSGAPWIGLGLLLALRRRRQSLKEAPL
jgi:hypothetical protein